MFLARCSLQASIACLFVALLFSAMPAFAEPDASVKQPSDVIWVAIAGALVFFMQAGFALLESGLSRSKNCINVVMKNYTDVCVGSLFFWLVGFGLMFGANPSGWIGLSGFALHNAEPWDYSFLLFQTMFAATAATIASGAMAERTRFPAYLFASVVITAVIYPIFGSWAWGNYFSGSGWLAEMGFIDFAGSTVVHSTGGWCALAGIIALGPRLGRFGPQGRPHLIAGHNLNFVALGGFILWFGWFGFNGGSTLQADANIGLIVLNTQLAASAGVACVLLFCFLSRSPITVPAAVNGSLAGLVGITAGCATMEPVWAIVTGASAGLVAYGGERLLVRLGLDDVVGAVAVHAFAGAWGTLCAGAFLTGKLFDPSIMLVQLLGVGACFLWSFGAAFLLFKALAVIGCLRADPQHEQRGLDLTEHAEVAYPEFIQHSIYNKSNLENIER
ncbi:ammonium transporter [Saccharophagus sp. K07]|uniref:ammonium transporter n=1 Tax=Saccharophagus sp. K07 TaxID=2283636 RepID=UPI002103550F|nr:ammonium transporter [Saccharophagus sp. K07]